MNVLAPFQRSTLRTLAQELGLSVTTVSRALKDGPEVHPDTVARVKAAAEAAGYRPDWRAVNLRTGRTGVIAVLYYAPAVRDDFGDTSVTMVVEGIGRRLAGTAYMPMVQLVTSVEDGLEHARRIVSEKLADGIIMSGTTPHDARVRLMQEHRFPFVTFGRTELPEHPWYDIDNEAAAHDATAWLAAGGRRRIALLAPPTELSFTNQRLDGYRRALAAAGQAFDADLVVNCDLVASSGRAGMAHVLSCADPADAAVCATGILALGALAGIRDAGLVPQRDVALVSRDGARLFEYVDPPLPTCFASSSDAGWALADLILAAIAGVPPAGLQTLVRTRLVVPPAR